MKIIRVFPRRTHATPIDENVYIGLPDMFVEADEVHVSVTFTWDIEKAEFLAKQWERVAPVKIGGPATGMAGGEFIPGLYLKKGYVITSRGCPNKCWFCDVWRREGSIREVKIKNGWNVLDDNLLACSEKHIRAVFNMLKRQSSVQFTGGLEAARLKEWHVELFLDVKPKQMFFTYDTPNDFEALVSAGNMLKKAGFKIRNPLRAYVLIGYPGDTIDKAEIRLYKTIKAGFMPMAMLYRDWHGKREKIWMKFQREWARPTILGSKIK